MVKAFDKKSVKRFLDLKVHQNKKTGQGTVMLPKRKIGDLPKKVRVSW